MARGLHFQPGALLDLTADDLEFWLSAAEQFEAQTKQE